MTADNIYELPRMIATRWTQSVNDHRNAKGGCAGVVCGASTSPFGLPSPIANVLRFRSSAACQVPRSVTVIVSDAGSWVMETLRQRFAWWSM
jgi:hypothetical protein